MNIDLRALRAVAEQAARKGGEAALRTFGGAHDQATKSGIYDIVTEGDKASEAAILTVLQSGARFPVVSEEGGGESFDAPYAWYIDPIDGTTNFANNLPHFSVSIALADRASLTPLVGVVYAPAMNELYSAARGQGVTLNGRPIHVSAAAKLNQSVLATGFPVGKRTLRHGSNLDSFINVLPRVRDLRRFGSAALDMAFVAVGRLDGFWEGSIHSWDILGALILVTEAGGTVSDYSGGGSRLYSGEEVVATNGGIHEELLEAINTAERGR